MLRVGASTDPRPAPGNRGSGGGTDSAPSSSQSTRPPSWVNSGRGLELQKLPRRTTNSSPRPLESRAGTHPQSSPEPGWRNLRLLSQEPAGWAAPGLPLVLLPLAPGCFLGWRCCPTAWQPHSFCLGSSLWFAKLGWEQILQKQAHALFSRLRNSSQLGVPIPGAQSFLEHTGRPSPEGVNGSVSGR